VSATQQDRASERQTAETSAGSLPDASLPEALTILLTGVVPALVRGLFSPRRSAMKLLGRVDADRRAASLIGSIRRRHEGEGVRLLGGKMVVLWGAEAIKEVLERSAELYASDSGAKAKGMSHFQPEALTLSRGEEWRDRREFTESVLATPERVHPDARHFLAVVAEEVQSLHIRHELTYEHWEELFDHITLRVIFGDGARQNQRLTQLLEQLMGEANRLVGLSHGDSYYEFYGELERQLLDPDPNSLIARFADAPHTDRTRVTQQIPHWMFAMRDTLAMNVYRALAVIVADRNIERRVREELEGADPSDPQAIDGMRYLEGCLHEAMRLWPTTPLLARETTQETTLAGEKLEPGTQVMVLNVVNHRDPDHVEDADRMVPERWASEERDFRFNHLSNGSQDCPGGPIVLLLGKAVIANVLDGYELELEHPRFDPREPLPHMLDFFETRFSARPREHA
jgi:cytochrome P450